MRASDLRLGMTCALLCLLVAAPAVHASVPGPAAAAAAKGRIALTVSFAGAGYDGAVPFVLVKRGDRDVLRRRISNGKTTISLPAGRYGLAVYWRPCGSRCRADDLPIDRCARTLPIRTASRGASETVTASAVFRAGEPCRLRLSSDWPPQPVVRTGNAQLGVARGAYCRPAQSGCRLPERAPLTRRRLPVRAGSLVSISFKVPTRRLRLSGICGSGPLNPSNAGRRWTFRVPAETTSSLRTCSSIGLTVTYAGPSYRRGITAAFGFRLGRAG